MLIALLLSVNTLGPFRYVSGDSVLLRSDGTPEGTIVDALPWATAVTPLGAPGAEGTLRVRVDGTEVSGFVHADLLAADRPKSQKSVPHLGPDFCGQPHAFGLPVDASTECQGFPLERLAPRSGELERALESSVLERRKLAWSLLLREDSVYATHSSVAVLNASPLLAPVPSLPHRNARQGDPDHAQALGSKELAQDKPAPADTWMFRVAPAGEQLLLGEGALPTGPVTLSEDKRTVTFQAPLTALVFNPCEGRFSEQTFTEIRYTLATGATHATPSDPALSAQLQACLQTRRPEYLDPRLLAQSVFAVVDQSAAQSLSSALGQPQAKSKQKHPGRRLLGVSLLRASVRPGRARRLRA